MKPIGVATTLVEYEANRGSGHGDDSHDSRSGRRTERATQKMESVFHISNCTVTCQIKFATCTLLGNALTWWNSHVKTVGHDAAYGMSWKALKKMMTDKYCLKSKIKKLEIEIWNLKVKGTDVVSYTQRFQDLALMCRRMFPEESDEVKKYVGGLPDMIQGSVMASKPKTMQDAIEISNDLTDKKIRTFAERQAKNKMKLDNDNQAQQQPLKKQNVARAYSAGSSKNKEYGGTLPLCNKCKFHHNVLCTVKCVNCKRVGYLTRDCRSPVATNNQRTITCYECGNQGHYKSDFLKLKNRNYENQAGGTEARGMVYALGGGETHQDLDNMEDDINA
ncbi:reverse transcriptase domain-containing protein [Tanacetum coccineum]